MPADQKPKAEKFTLCQNSGGYFYADSYGERLLFGTLFKLTDVEKCVTSSDPQAGKETGASYQMVLGSHGSSPPDLVKTETTTTQRIYALKMTADGAEARAAYDLVSQAPRGKAPDYPERYARLELICGDPAAFPEFNGWTGRIAMSVLSDVNSIVKYSYTFVGSAKGEPSDRALRFYTEVRE
jgi:hypothetical protein